MMERIELLAARYPRWGIARSIARAHYMRLRGDMQGGLREIESVMPEIAPGEHLDWAIAANTHTRMLLLSGQAERAAELGERYLQTCAEHALSPGHRSLLRTTAEALAARGELARGAELIVKLIDENESLGVRGLTAGLAYETQARVAIAARDAAAYKRAAALAAREYQRGKSPALLARSERLGKLAEQAGIEGASIGNATEPAQELSAAEQRLRACRDERERARETLSLLLEATGARGGLLLGWRDGGVRVLSSTAAHAPSAELLARGAEHLRQKLDASNTETAAASEEVTTASLFAGDGRMLSPILIVGAHDGETSIAALALLESAGLPLLVPSSLLEALGNALLEADDIDALTCVA
jgi:hypothetical protein